MLHFFVVILAAMLAITRCTTESESCVLNGYTAEIGEVFTPPGYPRCIKYKCDAGGLNIISDGCNMEGQCLAVDATIDKKCRTFKCIKYGTGGVHTYSVQIVQTLCQDKDGVCRKPGEKFPHIIGGRTYQKCSCKVTNNAVSYSCS